MNHPDHIHTPDDGRLVKGAIYADCRKGFVNVVYEPVTPNRRRTGVKWRTVWGNVEVVPK